jgi:hypothetical protein
MEGMNENYSQMVSGRSGPKLKVDSAPFEIKYF